MLAGRQRTIGCSWKPFCTDIEPAFLGVISLSGFGDWKIVHQRFSRWAKSGVFERIFKLLAGDQDNEYMIIDATIVRAHQHSAGARKKRRASIGRSRGGLTTKIRVLVDALGNPVDLMLTPGQAHDLLAQNHCLRRLIRRP